jgi:hypothetical protein
MQDYSDLGTRELLLTLIHRFEQEHQEMCVALRRDPFLTSRWTYNENDFETYDHGTMVASFAHRLREIMERFDTAVKEDYEREELARKKAEQRQKEAEDVADILAAGEGC